MGLDAGSRDNVTAVVCDVDFSGDVPASPAPAAFYGSAALRFTEGLETA